MVFWGQLLDVQGLAGLKNNTVLVTKNDDLVVPVTLCEITENSLSMPVSFLTSVKMGGSGRTGPKGGTSSLAVTDT